MNNIKALAVFCGSSSGNEDIYLKDAYNLGVYLAENNIKLIYGGSSVGIMGAVASGTLKSGGYAIGVIPDFIKTKEIANENASELIEVSSMHERKMIMHQKSDGAIILPGGFGTMDKMFELLTWGQLGLHQKPIGILNTGGYFNDLIRFLDNMVLKNLLRKSNRNMVLMSDNVSDLLEMMKHYEAPMKPKWMDQNQV